MSNLKQIFRHMKRVKNYYRSQLGEALLPSLVGIVMDGEPYADHDSTKPVEVFTNKNRKKAYVMGNDLATKALMKIKKILKVSECTKNISTNNENYYFTLVELLL